MSLPCPLFPLPTSLCFATSRSTLAFSEFASTNAKLHPAFSGLILTTAWSHCRVHSSFHKLHYRSLLSFSLSDLDSLLLDQSVLKVFLSSVHLQHIVPISPSPLTQIHFLHISFTIVCVWFDRYQIPFSIHWPSFDFQPAPTASAFTLASTQFIAHSTSICLTSSNLYTHFKCICFASATSQQPTFATSCNNLTHKMSN